MANPQKRSGRGFRRASGLLAHRIREAGESRGFAVSRLLTHWAEIAGPDMARVAKPVEVTYGRGEFGATLTLLTSGAQAPMVQMQTEKLRERVNAAYGYAAIAKIRITQTSSTGFAEDAAPFGAAENTDPQPETVAQAKARASGVRDTDLREALSRLGAQVLSRHSSPTGKS
jgi:hypothetical protein